MSDPPLEFAETVRFVRRPRQSLVLDLRTRRWVRMTTPGLAAVEAWLGDGIRAGADGEGPGRLLAEAVAFLREHGFLRLARGGAAADAERPPETPAARTLHLHVTHRCNLHCPTCYASDFLLTGPDVLRFDDLRRVMESAADTGYTRLTLSGGEPLLRRDLAAILELGRRRFQWISLTTNGTALTPRRAAELVGRVDHLNVSVDGIDAKTHDAIRGAGAFDRVMTGLRTLLAAGFPAQRISLSPTVTSVNHRNLDRMVDLAAELGTDVAFGFFLPTGRGLCNRDRFTLDPREMVRLFERAAARRREHIRLGSPTHGKEDSEVAFTQVSTDCSIGSILTVQADGSVFPCPNLIQPEHRLGNVRELDDEKLSHLLAAQNGKEPYACRVVDRVPGCRSCDARYFCGGGCMANAFMVTGDIMGRDPYCAFYRQVWRLHGPLQDDYAAARAEEAR